MKIVDPMQIRTLAVIPRTIRPLMTGSISHGAPGELEILACLRVMVSACQEAGSQHIGIVHQAAFKRNIADANTFALRSYLEVMEYVLAGAHRCRQVFRIPEMIISVEKCVPDQRRPHNRRHARWQIENTRLVVKVVSPAGARIPR